MSASYSESEGEEWKNGGKNKKDDREQLLAKRMDVFLDCLNAFRKEPSRENHNRLMSAVKLVNEIAPGRIEVEGLKLPKVAH